VVFFSEQDNGQSPETMQRRLKDLLCGFATELFGTSKLLIKVSHNDLNVTHYICINDMY
jgi:hypothetical protein